MAWSIQDVPDLTGKTAIVTGGNSGLGYETSLALAGRGAHTILACRNPAKAKEALAGIEAAHPGAAVETLALDLASLASVRAFADTFASRFPSLDILVNNAGVMALPYRQTADGFEMQLGTNHLGHFALTGALLERLQAASDARVVNVSSTMHRVGRMKWADLHGERGYSKWAAYGQSKLANLLFTSELARRLGAASSSVVTAASHPGYAATNLQATGPRMEGSSLMERVMEVGNRLLSQDAAAGALPSLYAATAPDVRADEYFGPDGIGEMTGAPKRVGRSRRAQSADDAARLWEVSQEATGIAYL